MWEILHVVGIYLVVALLAGLIAYLGNHMGRQIGRKKMSVLGLRPKHTSHFITTLTGSLIAIITLTLFAVVSEPVRQLLTGKDKLEKQIGELTKILRAKEEQVREFDKKLHQGRITYGVGEPILMFTLYPGLGQIRVRAQLSAALSAANLEAILKNNTIAAQNKEEPLNSDSALVQCSDSVVAEFMQQLSSQSRVVGVRIYAAQNCLYRDPIPVKLEIMAVSLVFREGETVNSQALAPNHPRFIKLWYDFLDKMKKNALRKGMIEVNNSLGGGLNDEDLARVSAELDNLTGSGTLVAVAKRDLYQTSPLDVRIEVRPDAVQTGRPSPTVSRAGRHAPTSLVTPSLVTSRTGKRPPR